MRESRPARTALILCLLAPSLFAAGYEDRDTGYKVSVPENWKLKFEEKEKTLWIAAPGGFRVRVDASLGRDGLGKSQVFQAYRDDGMRLKEAEGFLVQEKPRKDRILGKLPTYTWTFGYRSGPAEAHIARGFLAAGPARESGRELLLKVLAYGPTKAFEALEKPLAAFLQSFTWPRTSNQDASGPGSKDPTSGTGVSPGGATRPGTQVADSGDDGDDGRPASSTELARRPREGEFNRGSFSGGTGFMKFLKRNDNPEQARQLDAALGVTARPRGEEEQNQAAARLGFDTPTAPTK